MAVDSVDALAAALVGQASAADRDALEDVLAVLVLSAPPDQRDVDDDVVALLGRFSQRVGLTGAEDASETQQRIEGYLTARPPKVELLSAAARVAREQLAAQLGARLGDRSALANNLARFAGTEGPTGVLGGGERPVGSTPAGPLARFLVQKK